MPQRPTKWRRGTADGVIASASFAYLTTNAIGNDNETLVRLRYRYTVVAQSPGGVLTAMWHPGAHGVVVDDHSFINPPSISDAPLFSPDTSAGQPWLQWETWSYEHWNPVTIDPRWVGPTDHTERDTHAQRKLDFGTVPNNYALSFMWQIRDDIDWALVGVFVAWSALLMDAPA